MRAVYLLCEADSQEAFCREGGDGRVRDGRTGVVPTRFESANLKGGYDEDFKDFDRGHAGGNRTVAGAQGADRSGCSKAGIKGICTLGMCGGGWLLRAAGDGFSVGRECRADRDGKGRPVVVGMHAGDDQRG